MNFVGDAVALDYADSVADQLVTILGHRFRYRYRITRPIYVGSVTDVDAIVFLCGEVDGVLWDMFRNLHLNMPRGGARPEQDGEDDKL